MDKLKRGESCIYAIIPVYYFTLGTLLVLICQSFVCLFVCLDAPPGGLTRSVSYSCVHMQATKVNGVWICLLVVSINSICVACAQDVEEVVRMSLERYSADRIGKFDFALENSGGSVVLDKCSPTYPQSLSTVTLFGLPLWRTCVAGSAKLIIQVGIIVITLQFLLVNYLQISIYSPKSILAIAGLSMEHLVMLLLRLVSTRTLYMYLSRYVHEPIDGGGGAVVNCCKLFGLRN